MRLPRRQFLHLAAGAAALPGGRNSFEAQNISESACSSAGSMMLGIARCEVLSAADNAVAVMPGMEAIAWKRGAFALGDREYSFG
jgi:hypothetical protein